MKEEHVVVLKHEQIVQKIRRLATQILEENFGVDEIVLLGMNKTGYCFAELIEEELKKNFNGFIQLLRINLNPRNPSKDEITIEGGYEALDGKTIIIVDDVANTGRTLFYSFKPLMEILPKKVEVAVLVNRKHKSFPVKVDYMGLELATTMMENIRVDISEKENFLVILE